MDICYFDNKLSQFLHIFLYLLLSLNFNETFTNFAHKAAVCGGSRIRKQLTLF